MKTFTIIIVLVIVIIAGVLIFKGKNVTPTGETTTVTNPSGSDYTPPSNTTANGETAPTSNNVESPAQPTISAVIYNANGFVPGSLSVQIGTKVTFVNNSGTLMWIASNPHPQHTDLPGFDALKGYENNASYSYTFTKAGSWGFHDHLHPQYGGIIIVQ